VFELLHSGFDAAVQWIAERLDVPSCAHLGRYQAEKGTCGLSWLDMFVSPSAALGLSSSMHFHSISVVGLGSKSAFAYL
jgi:hypothetical protein